MKCFGLEIQYESALCCCSLSTVDNALPAHSSGKKALDLLDTSSPHRFILCSVNAFPVQLGFAFTAATAHSKDQPVYNDCW